MAGQPVERAEIESELSHDAGDKGHYRHYMQKEIYEQPQAILNTLEGRLVGNHIVPEAFGTHAREIFQKVKHVQIIACGTSYHSGMVARYHLNHWLVFPVTLKLPLSSVTANPLCIRTV